MDDQARRDLGDFLRTRRARVRPEDVGLPPGGHRRVEGLRREEVAQLAAVSVDYYVRLERGRVPNVSESVLDALARALRLGDDERAHLFNLARPLTARQRQPARQVEDVRQELHRLLDLLDAVPAVIIGRRVDILAWNRLGAAILADFAALPAGQRNWPRLAFLDPKVRRIYPDWEEEGRGIAGLLRLAAGRYPDDADLASLVDELSAGSADFRRWWTAHEVQDKTCGRKRFRNPVVGDLTLWWEALRIADDPDQTLIVYSAEPGSPSEERLRLLGSWSLDILQPSNKTEAGRETLSETETETRVRNARMVYAPGVPRAADALRNDAGGA